VNLPVATSISSFTVLVTDAGGGSQLYNNNGWGFPISDSVLVQTPQSCVKNGDLTVVAAVSFPAVSDLPNHINLLVDRSEAASQLL
jgi:hypothetical protein